MADEYTGPPTACRFLDCSGYACRHLAAYVVRHRPVCSYHRSYGAAASVRMFAWYVRRRGEKRGLIDQAQALEEVERGSEMRLWRAMHGKRLASSKGKSRARTKGRP